MNQKQNESNEKIYYKVLDNKMQNFSYHRVLEYKMNEYISDPMERGLYVFADLENVITEILRSEERKVQLIAGEIKIFKCHVKNIIKEYDDRRHYDLKRGTRVEQVKIIGTAEIEELWEKYEHKTSKFKEWLRNADSIEAIRSYLHQYDRDQKVRESILRLKNLSLVRELSESLMQKNPAVKEKAEEYWNLFDKYAYLFESFDPKSLQNSDRLPQYFNAKRQSFSDLLLLAEGQIYERNDLPDRVLTETNCGKKLMNIISEKIVILKNTIPLLKLMATRELSATRRLKTRMKKKINEFNLEVDKKISMLEEIKAKAKDDLLVNFPKPTKKALRQALQPAEETYSFEVSMKTNFGHLSKNGFTKRRY